MKNSNEKRKDVIALKYNTESDVAPKVIAKGKGLIADEIISKAKDFGVPIQEDPSLVEVLSKLEINQSIPEDLYSVVAELFAFIYRADKQMGK
ncbi:EscU/YscU/HrcU family type III secretion system export apparatus switch protein [Gottfriedia luciferensis]|uniref:EscU/YscU/HrcU family type III secretion system export apparatus switch protein n=1 Tax=Gottfriedia luciferensis TaxID=178774 RepID=UPI000B447D72|nr:EscU/YscU/HrcU family type III secretion system export apparatus switch protein [Gottfriedia luciferensis]